MAIEIERLNGAIADLVEKREHEKSDLCEEIERLNNALRLKVIESQEWQEQVNRSGEVLNQKYSDLVVVHQQLIR